MKVKGAYFLRVANYIKTMLLTSTMLHILGHFLEVLEQSQKSMNTTRPIKYKAVSPHSVVLHMVGPE